jgi:hypothetical protein
MAHAQQPIVYVLIAAFVVGRFLVRELRERHLSNTQLFVLPGIMLCLWLYFAVTALRAAHVDGVQLGVRSAIALPFGALVGIAIARFTTVRIGGDGKIFFRGSYVTVAIWTAALIVRFAARYVFPIERGASAALGYAASLLLLAFVATATVRILVYRKAQGERAHGTTLAETAF